MRVSNAGLFEIPIEDQQESSEHNTLITTESVCQTILARPFATARSTWIVTATVKTRLGSKLSGTAVLPTPFLSSFSSSPDGFSSFAPIKDSFSLLFSSVSSSPSRS